jgi:hypothetical protein
MFGTGLCMSIAVAGLQRAGVAIPAPVALSLILEPLSVIQMKAVRRSFVVHRQEADDRRVVIWRVIPDGDVRRAA